MTAPGVTTESSKVRFGQTVLEYQIKRTARTRTVSVAVVPKEGLVVTAPERATKERLDEVVRQKGAWVIQRLKRQSDLPPPLPMREFVSGETYKYLGRQYRLRVVTAAEGGLVRLQGGLLTLGLSKALPARLRRTEVRLALVAWYRARAKDYLPHRATEWASKFGLAAPRIIVSEPEKRWGSASKDGSVRINWRVMQAPVSLVDYVLAHELSHLLHEDHSRQFWATLGAVMPDYETRKNRLRELGSALTW
jgi:predicted metal-dependent hydrolase